MAASTTPPPAPKQYVVVVPLVITKNPDDTDKYVYLDGLLPAATSDAEVARLLEGGFVKLLDGAAADPIAESN